MRPLPRGARPDRRCGPWCPSARPVLPSSTTRAAWQEDTVETALTELHKKYKYMEASPPNSRAPVARPGRPALALTQGSSKSWSDVSQKIIKRQRAAIEKLKADNGALKHELALEARAPT